MTTKTILVRSMGKVFPARGFATDKAANAFCEKHPDWGVIAQQADGIVYVASKYPFKAVASDLLTALLTDLDSLY